LIKVFKNFGLRKTEKKKKKKKRKKKKKKKKKKKEKKKKKMAMSWSQTVFPKSNTAFESTSFARFQGVPIFVCFLYFSHSFLFILFFICVLLFEKIS